MEKYKDKWNWHLLSNNNSICWTEKRINQFSQYIDFKCLSRSKNIKLSFSLLKNYENKWDWFAISSNPTIVRELGVEILNHERIIWVTKPSYQYHDNLSGTRPCISTNVGIEWDIELFELYKDKIDFWLLAYFGKLDNSIIEKYGNELDENRVVFTNFTKSSDWRDEHPWYRNGWENIFLNSNFYFDIKIANSIRSKENFWKIKEINLIRFSGNAREGHNEYTKTKAISHLIDSERLNFTFEQLANSSHILSPKLISQTYIHHKIFDKIIKPELLNDEKLIRTIFDKFIHD